MDKRFLVLAVTLISTNLTYANTKTIDTVTVIGSTENAQQLPGSASLISNEQMQQQSVTDINQVLKTVPGVYIREEDGFGLRPNIGIRAASGGRSANITLMEDGVLIAPAPYSNPAAYYFPTTTRIDSIEVLKGAPLLRYGPQTVGGAVNLVSTPIPYNNSGRALFMVNDRSSTDMLLSYGGTSGNWGYMLETVQRNYNGYKDIDRSAQDTGFDIEDYVAKLSWQDERNLFLLKLQHSEENSRETYTGLTDADFKKNPNRRYGITAMENMDNDHDGINLSHTFEWSHTLSSTTTVYRNEFNRDWFKTGKSKDLINDANSGSVVDQNILDGNADFLNIEYLHGNRAYTSQGIQTNFNWLLGAHTLDMGARFHKDEMDRFQPIELFDQINGALVNRRPQAGEVKGGNNRIEKAEAISLWVVDNYQVSEDLLVNFSARMEDVKTKRDQYDNTARTASTGNSKKENDYTEFMAGIGATYSINNNWQLLAGFYQGMSPLDAGAENQKPETSKNIEVGFRFQQAGYHIDSIVFYSDFKNSVELCSIANPCSNGNTSGNLSIGGAEVSGLELNAGKSFAINNLTLPVELAYTYTKAETKSNGGAVSGLTLKDIPENTASIRAGIEHANGWNNYLVATYIDETCAVNGCNKTNDNLERTDALTTVDLISRYQLSSGPEVFIKASNVFNDQEIISRSPYGARPNMERTISLGMDYRF